VLHEIHKIATQSPSPEPSLPERNLPGQPQGRIHPAQTMIYHQGDNFDGFFRVNSGIVMVYRLLENSQRQISGFLTEGQFFGLTGDDVHHDTAVTVATSNIIKLTHSDIDSDNKLQMALFKTTCHQLEEAQMLITTLTKKSASEKIAFFLVNLARSQNLSGETFNIRLPMSRLDIADYLGMTIETVSRRLTVLKSDGIISLPDRNTVRIHQFGRLLNLAGPQ
jgi:CRP-like cAMP-binding protein